MTTSHLAELELVAMHRNTSREMGRRLQVLVLDDDETDRLRITRTLARSGLSADITEAESLGAFRKCLAKQSFDIVFIDFWLGFENGLDALDTLMSQPGQERAAAIMLSRATEPDVIVQAMRAGCADYIVKDTLDVETLRSCIASAFERRVLLGAMRENRDLRRAIRRLVERLSKGQVFDPSETPERSAPRAAHAANLSASAAKRLSSGLLADLELLWHLRRA